MYHHPVESVMTFKPFWPKVASGPSLVIGLQTPRERAEHLTHGAMKRRANPSDPKRVAYTWEEFHSYYGDAAEDQWDAAWRVFDENQTMLVCYVCFEAPGGPCEPWCTCRGAFCGAWCEVDALKESSFLRGLLECMAPDEPVVLKLGRLFPVEKKIAQRVLEYFRFQTSWWQHCPEWGALEYADKLGLHRLVNIVATGGCSAKFREWVRSTGEPCESAVRTM